MILSLVCVHVDPFRLTNLKQQYTTVSKVTVSKVTASLRILENLETFLYNSKKKSGFHSVKEHSLGSAVKYVVKSELLSEKQINQYLWWILLFSYISNKFLVKYLRVPFYKGSSGFSIWQMLNEITIRFEQYCVSQMPYYKTHFTTLLLIYAWHKSYLPFASLSHQSKKYFILFPQQGYPWIKWLLRFFNWH